MLENGARCIPGSVFVLMADNKEIVNAGASASLLYDVAALLLLSSAFPPQNR
jgi:hypothetical protein